MEAFDPGSIGRIVIRAPNWLGDAVMALPAMAAVRRTFPRSTLAVAAPPGVAPMFEELTAAGQDELLTVEGRSETSALRAGRFDLAIVLPNSFRSAWIVRRARVPHRWGRGSSARGWLLTRSVRPRQRPHHQSARYLALMDALDIDASDEHPRVSVTPESAKRASELFAKQALDPSSTIVGLAPGAAYGHAKRWPPSRMAELARRLIARGARPVLVGATADRDAGREIESALPSPSGVVNLIGRTDLRLLIGVLQRCRAFVSNDSGAMHLAAAVGVPVTAIFGPTDERVTSPIGHPGNNDVLVHQVFCRPCMLRDCPIDHRCMKRITVDTVYDAVVKRL